VSLFVSCDGKLLTSCDGKLLTGCTAPPPTNPCEGGGSIRATLSGLTLCPCSTYPPGDANEFFFENMVLTPASVLIETAPGTCDFIGAIGTVDFYWMMTVAPFNTCATKFPLGNRNLLAQIYTGPNFDGITAEVYATHPSSGFKMHAFWSTTGYGDSPPTYRTYYNASVCQTGDGMGRRQLATGGTLITEAP